MRATCPTHLHNLIVLIIFCEEYELQSTFQCNFDHSTVNFSLLDPDTLIIRFSLTSEWTSYHWLSLLCNSFVDNIKRSGGLKTISVIQCNKLNICMVMDIHTYIHKYRHTYAVVSKSFRTGRLERELQMVQLSTTSCSFNAILWVSLVSFAAITLCVASQRVFIVIVYFVIDSVRKILDTPSYKHTHTHTYLF
jgi:hypothetical protein